MNSPSRFLDNIPRHLVSSGGLWPGTESRTAPSVHSRDSLPAEELKAGNHIRHSMFGNGVVVSCQSVDGDSEVVVAFNGAGVKKLLLSFARLEKVE